MWSPLPTLPTLHLLQQSNAPLIALYFTLNTVMTLINKLVATEAPYHHHVSSLLGAAHAAATWLGCILYQHFTTTSNDTSTELTAAQQLKVFIFALLYTTNISLSNYSTALASLPMWQSIRATGPLLTILILLLVEGTSSLPKKASTYISLLLIVAGVIASVHGERWHATLSRLSWTFAGALAAVIKSYVQHRLPKFGVQLSANELLRATLPFAVVQSLLASYMTGELGPLIKDYHSFSARFVVVFGLSAAVAFCLNIVSFRAFGRVAPTSMAVAANLKQVVILFLPFHARPVTGQMVGGTLVTVGGTIWYSVLQMGKKKRLVDVSSGGAVEMGRLLVENLEVEMEEVEGRWAKIRKIFGG